MGTVLCEHCTAACCRYIALPIDTPETMRDFEDMRWFVLHRGISVFVEDGDWYVQMQADCRMLRPDGLCATYETRPPICREYTTDECDYHAADAADDAPKIFEDPEALMAYGREYLKARRARRAAAEQRKRRRPKKGPRVARSGSVTFTISAARRKGA